MDSGLGFVQPMFFVGVVEDRDDPRAEGRVKVRAFGVHGSNRDIPTTELPWATLIIGNHDVNFTPPPLNAWVFGFFIDGRDAQQPMILGLIPSQSYELVDPNTKGWGTVPAENYDLHSQGTRPRDLGLSPLSNLATGEFLNETYNEPLETNRVRNIPIAGGCARNHFPTSNGNLWSNEFGENAAAPSGPQRPISATEQQRINDLDNDAEFQAELQRLSAKHGVSREQVYGIIGGESSYNPSVINSAGYAGFFQFGNEALADINARNGTNYTPQSIAASSPAEQLRVYDMYLERWNFRNSSGLGVMQAAPGYAGRPGDTEVYAVGSRAWQQNPGWRGADGRITVDSINAYYNRRNPPPVDGAAPAAAATPQETAEQQLGNAEQIRARIAEIDKQMETETDSDKIKALVEERAALEAQLAALDSSGATEGTAGDPYSGYATPPTDPSCATTWDEPASGYNAKYPFNRVIQTAAGHSIELDDTPGGERIMIWHKSGSYIQITNSSTTTKNMADSYDVNERNQHVYIGGNNIITIEGDSYVLVKGNKVEEIVGDYKQIVHGNIMVGGAGRVEINGADRTDIRSASLGLDSNVENLNIRTGKNIVFESGETINLKSKNIRIGASENMSVSGETGLFLQAVSGDVHLKSKGNTFMNPEQNLYLKTDSGSVSVQSEGPLKMNSAGSFVSINANSTMNLGAKNNLMVASSGGSVNVNASENLGLSGKMTYMQGKTDVNIMAAGGQTNIGASADITIASSGGNLFAQASSDVNVKSGANMKVEATSNMDLKTENMKLSGTAAIEAKSTSIKMESSGAMSAKGNTVYLEGAGNVNIKGGGNAYITAGIVYIDDIVQLANGGNAAAALGAAEASGADEGNEVMTKEEVQPAKFDDAASETPGGDSAGQAKPAEAPMGAQSGAVGPAAPPDRAPPAVNSVTRLV